MEHTDPLLKIFKQILIVYRIDPNSLARCKRLFMIHPFFPASYLSTTSSSLTTTYTIFSPLPQTHNPNISAIQNYLQLLKLAKLLFGMNIQVFSD